MKLTQIACCLLLASAFVLGAVLIDRVDDRVALEPQAQAEMVISQGLFTVMSTGGKSNEEYVYLLDTRSSMLVCYEFSASKKRLEVVGTLDVGRTIQMALNKTDSDNPGTRRRDR